MLTQRQEQILNSLIKEYIDRAEPVSSELLKKRCNLNVSPATIRNDLQDLTQKGYISQPHTSAGRVPTEKGYRYFAQIVFNENGVISTDFIFREIEETKEKVDQELNLAKKLTEFLENLSSTFDTSRMEKMVEEEMLFNILKIMGPSKTSYNNNIKRMGELLEEFENL
ncbi:MAG: DeoR family transcriptional regulator [Patescibacteria group bacterium]